MSKLRGTALANSRNELIGVLARTDAILASFEPQGGALNLTTIVKRTGLPKATAHRLLMELQRLRLVERANDQSFQLGGRLFELGMLASIGRGLIEIASPFLQDLHARTNETVHLGVREGSEVVYIAKVGGHHQDRIPSRLGGRMPLHCTAIGKVLLAFGHRESTTLILQGDLVRRTPHTVTAPGLLAKQLGTATTEGVAYEHEESMVGIACVAAPILDIADEVVAAVSVAGHVSRFQPKVHANLVRVIAQHISSALAARHTRVG